VNLSAAMQQVSGLTNLNNNKLIEPFRTSRTPRSPFLRVGNDAAQRHIPQPAGQ
jgi:hypothetical protein